MISPSDASQRLVIHLDAAPGANDELVVWSPTSKVSITLVTPSGKRITEDSADKEGLDWRRSLKIDSAAADSAMTISIRLNTIRQAGAYTFEIVPNELQRATEISAVFRPEVKVPGIPEATGTPMMDAIIKGPVRAAPRGTIEFQLMSEEDAPTVDILISSGEGKVSLALPQGAVIQNTNANMYGFKWVTTDNPKILDAPGTLFTIGGMYLPGKGMHHLITMPRAMRGLYRVVVDAEQTAEFSVGVFPTGRLLQATQDLLERQTQAKQGEVRMTVDPITANVHVGDNVLLVADFSGEPVRRPIDFRAVIEYRDILPGSGPEESRLGPPETKTAVMHFGWGMDNTYRGYLQPDKQGRMQMTLQAKGRTTTGLPFDVEAKLPAVTVMPLAARFQGLWEQPVDTDNNGVFDRLDIHVELEVLQGATFEGSMALAGRFRKELPMRAQKQFAPGRQRLTFSFPSTQILSLATDGPYEVKDLRIVMKKADGSSDDVSLQGIRMQTQPYRRAQWTP